MTYMQRSVRLSSGGVLNYEYSPKRVKNINLRISQTGEVKVSAPFYVSVRRVEAFLLEKEAFILKALEAAKLRGEKGGEWELTPADREKARAMVDAALVKFYPAFQARGVAYPKTVRFRDMKSRWGSCAPAKGAVTFNLRLAFYPPECAEYVVVHELAHFLETGHNARFWAVVAAVLPDWKARRKMLRG